jgi:4-hydroxy-4-methyl-2-oxoglutarate aldolase
MVEPLSPRELDALRRLNTPTVSNAIEAFNTRPRSEGFMDPSIRCIFPELGVMVGYACTATVSAREPAPPDLQVSRFEQWDNVLSIPAPRVMVIHDLDDPPAVGSYWGEVQSNIYRALGCVGTVTDGSVRDLDEVRELGFHFFAAHVSVSHAYVHLVDFGQLVKVGGLTVHPGDLIHADQHGVLVVPHKVARDVVAAAAEVERVERQIIDYCKSPDFDVEGLKSLYKRLRG